MLAVQKQPIGKNKQTIFWLFFMLSILVGAFFPAFSYSQTEMDKLKKLFIYSSELPKPLLNSHYVFRKHVVDVILATQKYNLMFSEIPERLVKSQVPQFIIKYKIRTSDLADTLYNLELTLFDADKVVVSNQVIHENIPLSKLYYQFRLRLYEFILNRSLTNEEEIKFDKASSKKITQFKKSLIKPKKSLEATSTNSSGDTPPSPNQQTKTSSQPSLPSNQKNAKDKSEKPKKELKPSLWTLLKDDDRDKSWFAINQSKKEKDDSKKEDEQSNSNNQGAVKPFVNPFLNIGSISLKGSDEFSLGLGTDQFHFAWKVVQRSQKISDIIKLTNEFNSLLGFTFEWLIYQPIHVSRFFLRTGIEFDKALNTKPIELNDHFLFRMGLGYRLPGRWMPSVYYERSSLVYANLNNLGDGVTSNLATANWINLEWAYLGIKTYSSVHFAKSISVSDAEGITRATESLGGFRFGANVRYFFSNKYLKLKWWGDIEYRREQFEQKNTNTTLEISKEEISFRIGFHI